ncbi:hypothetical protein MHM582_2253 [Microbacterium sp. HM58-2]|nr:hypothetical protein MHM582_2253 [Microbacterium sp. HM58-2]
MNRSEEIESAGTAAGASEEVLLVFESMFGSTRRIAEAIADGIRTSLPAGVHRVADLPSAEGRRLVVVGAPTHAHSLSRPESRAEGRRWARDRARFALEPGPHDIGVREWIPVARLSGDSFAAFDTRIDMPRIFTGSAAGAISKRLRRRGLRELLPPESFLVDKDSRLLPGEAERAFEWGRTLGAALRAETGDAARRESRS